MAVGGRRGTYYLPLYVIDLDSLKCTRAFFLLISVIPMRLVSLSRNWLCDWPANQ